MAKIQTIRTPEDFIVQMNGDYNVCFGEFIAPKAVAIGEVVEDGTDCYISAVDAKAQDVIRGLTRGNPTTVNERAITGLNATNRPKLEAKGIVFVNV